MGNAMVAYAEEAKNASGGVDQQGQAELQANNAVSSTPPGVLLGCRCQASCTGPTGKAMLAAQCQ